MSSGSDSIFLGNLITSFMLSASLQYLYDLISSQQLVILLPLFSVSIPANAYMFFQQLMRIAAIELAPTDEIYSHFSDLKGIPASDTFEEIGFEHHLLMNNFGTMGLIFVILPLLYAA